MEQLTTRERLELAAAQGDGLITLGVDPWVRCMDRELGVIFFNEFARQLDEEMFETRAMMRRLADG